MAVNWEAINEAIAQVKAVGYCRVSTIEQIKGISLEYQEEKIKKWIGAMDYTEGEMYIEKGESGAKEDRSELTRLLEDAKAGKFNMVIVWKVDRFSRDLSIAVDTYNKLKKLGINLFIIDGNIDTSTPMGKMLFYQLSMFAEMEKDNITERLSMGRANKALNGSYIGKKPYGYNVTDGKLEIKEYEANIIRDIFKKKVYGKMSLRAIAENLKDDRIPSPSGNTEWNHNSIAQIIKNKLYIGEFSYTVSGKRYTAECDAIIAKQVFGRANSK